MIYKYLIRPLLFQMETEQAHDSACRTAIRFTGNDFLQSVVRGVYNYQTTALAQTFWGLTFRNPLGLAAGFDKNGQLIHAIETLGMGFTEVGSITAKASEGNPKPRAFRLVKDEALINRMGLNNKGAHAVVRSLQKSSVMPIGVNIAKTHDAAIMGDAAIRDYLFSYNKALKVADYITINISCPNTTDGKTFEDPKALEQLLSELLPQNKTGVPTLVKLSPDLSQVKLKKLIDICESHRISGYVACNTSLSHSNLNMDSKKLDKIGRGGVSGKPIASKSIATIKSIRNTIGDQKPIIGVGGIHSFETALQMLRAGANLLQIYTGLVYEGPGLVKRINQKLSSYLRNNNVNSIINLY